MLKYIDKEKYIELLGADSIPDNFDNLVIEASSYINLHTFGRIDINSIPEQVKYATCLIVNEIIYYNNSNKSIGNVKSESVSKCSKTYKDSEQIKKEYETNKKYILTTYLHDVLDEKGTPLLYRGD